MESRVGLIEAPPRPTDPAIMFGLPAAKRFCMAGERMSRMRSTT